VTLAPTVAPATAQGTLEVFEPSQKGDGAEPNKVVVPVTFGPALLSPYHGFSQYAVAPGDTLTSLAQQWYGDPNDSGRIAEANRAASLEPSRQGYLNADQVDPWAQGALYRLYTAPEKVSDIALQPGEDLVRSSVDGPTGGGVLLPACDTNRHKPCRPPRPWAGSSPG